MAGVGKLIKQAQKIQKKMEALQAELAEKEIEVSSGGGAVTVKVSLQQEVRAISLDPEFLKEEKSFIEETIVEAVREAIAASKTQSEEAMSEITSGFSMPGMM
ncbi:MAG: YbaB/EbfC family nucleoid-associated protein [Opitutales bacterium]|nr:YbaB/EbfC family nucleoid-associated protein [Opitutales bacterium]